MRGPVIALCLGLAIAGAVVDCRAASILQEHGWEVGSVELCTYVYQVDTELSTAGDTVSYRTLANWQFSLGITAATDEALLAEMIILSIKAKHLGGGSEHSLDTFAAADEPGSGADDPLLGHLRALTNQPLRLRIARATGQVTVLAGTDALAQAVAARAHADPGEPSPLAAAAAETYSAERLGRLLSTIFALPSDQDPQVELGLPGAGTVIRRWQGNSYRLSLPEAAEAPSIQLHDDPVPVHLRLTELSGSGKVRGDSRGFNHAQGTFQAVFEGTFTTQPVTMRLSTEWQLGLWQTVMANAATAEDAETDSDNDNDTMLPEATETIDATVEP